MHVTLDRLARPTGTFAMVAMDQRESLRTMLAEHGHPADDAALAAFKLEVADALAPLASAFLIDRHHAYDTLVRERPLPPGCGMILAVDALSQPPGGAVEDTAIDEDADLERAAKDGVVALKLLVIWKRDGDQERRVEMAHRFVERSRAAGLLSVLEPVAVMPPGEEAGLDDAILDAAAALAPADPDLYKAQVPSRGRGEPGALVSACERLGRQIGGPWVVLSNGVEAADFPAAVEAACRGGASGMLAGRALWRDALATTDPPSAVRAESVERLRRLIGIVDTHGRSWSEVG
jgi:sulfofructosephosphate aldolase